MELGRDPGLAQSRPLARPAASGEMWGNPPAAAVRASCVETGGCVSFASDLGFACQQQSGGWLGPLEAEAKSLQQMALDWLLQIIRKGMHNDLLAVSASDFNFLVRCMDSVSDRYFIKPVMPSLR